MGPAPGALEGVKSRSRAIVKMQNCTFTYPSNTVPTIADVTFQVSLVSRVGVCGKNGEGKSTAIKLLTGENIPQAGTVYKHQGVRLGYLAQHSFDTIDQHPDKTANEYIRWRLRSLARTARPSRRRPLPSTRKKRPRCSRLTH